ncbi:hypothetical protein [Bradyrhizobium sp. 142]|nr:hypothetical protein [Bradyrhizobium sp. 142]
MAWKALKILEVSMGMEINTYACASASKNVLKELPRHSVAMLLKLRQCF